MMKVSIIPATREERDKLDEQRAREAERDQEAHREHLAAANRAAGHREPTPGSELSVASKATLRRRSGLDFSPTPRVVRVVDASDEEILERQQAGECVVNQQGAEEILADSNSPQGGLTVFESRPEAVRAQLVAVPTEQLEAMLINRARAQDSE